jgi:hypothetical protein
VGWSTVRNLYGGPRSGVIVCWNSCSLVVTSWASRRIGLPTHIEGHGDKDGHDVTGRRGSHVS